MRIFRPYNQNLQESIDSSKKNLIKYLEALAIDGLTTYTKRSNDENNKFCPLADINIVNNYNNCYCNHNNITAFIIEGKMYIIPTGIIKEFLINSCNLTSKEFKVPLSDSDYVFEKEKDNKKWNNLLRLQVSLKVKK